MNHGYGLPLSAYKDMRMLTQIWARFAWCLGVGSKDWKAASPLPHRRMRTDISSQQGGTRWRRVC